MHLELGCRRVLCAHISAVIHLRFLFCPFVGPSGIGLNELKRKLLICDSQHYGVTVPREYDPFNFSSMNMCLVLVMYPQ